MASVPTADVRLPSLRPSPTGRGSFFNSLLKLNFKSIMRKKTMGSCCSKQKETTISGNTKKVALVGNPNVGKSVLFNALTGAYVTVSNYPGTSVEVARGNATIEGEQFEVIDT